MMVIKFSLAAQRSLYLLFLCLACLGANAKEHSGAVNKPPVSVYDLNKHVEEENYSITDVVDFQHDKYFVEASMFSYGVVLWHYSGVTGKSRQLILPGGNGTSGYSSLQLVKVQADELLVFSRDLVWRITAEQPLPRLVDTPLDKTSFQLVNATQIGNQVLFQIYKSGFGNDLWKYSGDCACFSSFNLIGKSKDIRWVVELNGHVFATVADQSSGSDRDVSRLYRVDVNNNQLVLISNTSGEPDEHFYHVSLWNVMASETGMVFLVTGKEGKRTLWRYTFATGVLSELTTVNTLMPGEHFNYYPEVLAYQDDMLILQRSVVSEPISDTSKLPEKYLYAYDVRRDEITLIADLKHPLCKGYFAGEYLTTGSSLSAKVALAEGSLFYVSNELETGFRLWHYDLESGVKADITPELFMDTAPRTFCYQQDFFKNSLVLKNKHLFFYTDKYDKYTRKYDPSLSGLWRLDLDNIDSYEADHIHAPMPDLGSNYYSDLVPFGDDFVFTYGTHILDGRSVFSGWHLSGETLTQLTDDNGNPLLHVEIHTTELPLLLSAVTEGTRDAVYQLSYGPEAEKVAQPINNSNSVSFPGEFVDLGDKMYFLAYSGTPGQVLWETRASGTPKLLPVQVDPDTTIYNMTLVNTGENTLLLTVKTEGQGRLPYQYLVIDTRNNTSTPLSELNNVEAEFLGHEGNTLYFNGDKVWAYDLLSGDLTVANDNPGEGHLFIHEGVLYRWNYPRQLWRSDLQSGEWVKIRFNGFKDYDFYKECDHYRVADNFTVNKVGKYLFFSDFFNSRTGEGGSRNRGVLVRYNPDADSYRNVSCDGELVEMKDWFLLLKYKFGEGESLHRINKDYSETELVAEFKSIESLQYVPDSNVVYFTAKLADDTLNLYRYDTKSEPQLLHTFEHDFDRFWLWLINGEIVVATELKGQRRQDAEIKIWRGNLLEPVFQSSDLVFPFSTEFAVFAGDIWFAGIMVKDDYFFNGELLRLHLNEGLLNARTRLDFDGDGITDMGFREKTKRNWNILLSGSKKHQNTRFGLSESDIPLPGDYDGDGITDLAFRRLNTNIWYVKNSGGSNYNSDKEDGIQRVVMGLWDEDIPVPGDYDGDGITDMAVRRPSWHAYLIRFSSTGAIEQVKFGRDAGDIPVAGDFDGDGKADIAFRRPGTKTWYVKNSSGSNYNSERQDGIQRVVLGLHDDDIPTPADFDGDGITDMAIWRPSQSRFFVRYSATGEIAPIAFQNAQSAVSAVGDYDGDGQADAAIYFADTDTMQIRYSAGGEDVRVPLPSADDALPLALPISEMMKRL